MTSLGKLIDGGRALMASLAGEPVSGLRTDPPPKGKLESRAQNLAPASAQLVVVAYQAGLVISGSPG